MSEVTEHTEGFLRELPGNLGLYIEPMMFTTRICVGPLHRGTYDEVWCYHSTAEAVLAAVSWDPETDPEPKGWHRHPSSGRRRPDGNPAQEFVRNDRDGSEAPTVTCPRCRSISFNRNDIEAGYCGRCHDRTSPPRTLHEPD